MNDGWLCDSILKTAHRPSPMSTAPAFSPGPLHDARAGGRQRLQVHARALVAAVLRPHHREQAELEQVGLAAHQLLDAVVLVRLDAVPFEQRVIDHGHDDGPAQEPDAEDQSSAAARARTVARSSVSAAARAGEIRPPAERDDATCITMATTGARQAVVIGMATVARGAQPTPTRARRGRRRCRARFAGALGMRHQADDVALRGCRCRRCC